MKILVLGQMWISPAVATDETRICEALRGMGHEVLAYDWKDYLTILDDRPEVDFVLASKGLNHKRVHEMKGALGVLVFYWCWDVMDSGGWPEVTDVTDLDKRPHFGAALTADGYFGNNLALAQAYREHGATFHYLPMDVAASPDTEGYVSPIAGPAKFPGEYQIAFTGTHYVREWSNRPALLAQVRDAIAPVELHIFGQNWEQWEADGFLAHPGVWGQNYARLVVNTEINLALGSRNDIEGCWSNRIAWILMHGGFALARYVPGMERAFGPDGESLAYWDSAEDCADKVRYYLERGDKRLPIADRGRKFARRYLTFEHRLQQMLTILRYEHGIG